MLSSLHRKEELQNKGSLVLSDAFAGELGGSPREVWKAWSSPPFSSLGLQVDIMLCSQPLSSTSQAPWAWGKVGALLHGKQCHICSFPACQSSWWQHKGVPSSCAGCKPPLWQGRKPQLSQAQQRGRCSPGEGGWWCAGVAGRDVQGAVVRPRQSPTGNLGHAQSGFAQPLPKAGPGTSLCPLGPCWDSGADIQGYAGAELSPTAHSCSTIVESLTTERNFSLLICMIFFGEWWSFGLYAFSLICLKSPILGHPNSFSQEKLDSAPGLLRNGCSRAKWSVPVRNWMHNIQRAPGVRGIGLRLAEKSSAWQRITSVQKGPIQLCIPRANTAARWYVQQQASLINFLLSLRTE